MNPRTPLTLPTKKKVSVPVKRDGWWVVAWWLVAAVYLIRLRFFPVFGEDPFAVWWNAPISTAIIAFILANGVAERLRMFAHGSSK